jgi:hypothetical protein
MLLLTLAHEQASQLRPIRLFPGFIREKCWQEEWDEKFAAVFL